MVTQKSVVFLTYAGESFKCHHLVPLLSAAALVPCKVKIVTTFSGKEQTIPEPDSQPGDLPPLPRPGPPFQFHRPTGD